MFQKTSLLNHHGLLENLIKMEFRLLNAIKDRLDTIPNKSSRSDQTTSLGHSSHRLTHTINPSHEQVVLRTTSRTKDQSVEAVLDRPRHRGAQSLSSQRPSYKTALDKRAAKVRSLQLASKELLTLHRSNLSIKNDLKVIREQVQARTRSMNETHQNPGPKAYLQKLAPKPQPVKKKPLKPLLKTFNFIQHNKQTIFNLHSACERPISEINWTKSMQMSPRFQIGLNATEDDLGWQESPDKSLRPSKMDFSRIEDSMLLMPSFKYCKACKDSGQYIELKRQRSRSVIQSSQ